MKNTEKSRNPNVNMRCGKAKNLQVHIYCGGSPPFSGSIQGDAAAWDENDVRSVAAAELERPRSREEEDTGKERMRKDQSWLFIRKD